MSLTIGYLNVEGLRAEKHQACCSLIDAGLFDILFLSETWFPKSFNYMSHPYSFVHTPHGKVIEKSRPGGGILAMVSTDLKPHINSHLTTPHGILLDVDGIKLLAVYLAPSLSSDDIERSLAGFGYYDALFGDLNVRFRNHSRSRNLSTRKVQEFWLDWLMRKSLAMSSPRTEELSISQEHKTVFDRSHSSLLSRGFSPIVGDPYQLLSNCELDHLFHTNLITPSLQLLGSHQFNLKTVHPYFLRFTLPFVTVETVVRQTFGRFHLEVLEKPGISDLLAMSWTKLASEIDWSISDVDVYDSVLVHSVQAVAEEILGLYDVLERRKAPDKVQPFLHSHLSAAAAISLFKRKQRNMNPTLTIQAVEKGNSAMDECMAKFHSTFYTDATKYDLPSLPLDLPLVSELTSLVNVKDISEFITKYPKDKACGLDSIHTILIQALQSTPFYSRLSALYALCIRSGRTPARWNRSVMYLLPKKPTPPITCDSVRPLSILTMFRRIFEGLLIKIFTDPNKSFSELHPTQAGFRRGYSTLTHAAICHHAISTKTIQHAVFLDFKAAYDVTLEFRVMTALQKRGMPARLQHLIHSLMFQHGSFQLIVNDQLSSAIERNRGLPQGSPLSPIIFNMFVDSLSHMLNNNPQTILPQSLFFADDGLLLCRTDSEVTRALTIAQKWAQDNDMIYNVAKCGIISLYPAQATFTLSGSEIPIVDSYKYLGFVVNRSGIDFTKHLQLQVDTGTSFLKFLQVQCSEWTPYTRYVIYNTFLRPKLEYGAPLVYSLMKNQELYSNTQSLQNQVIAWIFNSNVKHIKVLDGILGVLTVYQRFQHLRCSFQLHLDNSALSNPIRPLVASLPQLSCFRSDPLYTQFKSNPDLPIPYPALKKALSCFLTSQRSGILSQSKSILVNYISPKSRTEGLVDKVLQSPIHCQRLLLSWRRGALFLLTKCICGKPWNRGHISCFSQITLSDEHQSEYILLKEGQSKNFCQVDYLLNIGEWDLVMEILRRWEKEFSKSPIVGE